jgi:hypothetical protein
MKTHRQNDIGIADVELLLQHRELVREELHHDVLLKMAEVISGDADRETALMVDEHLATCDSCREALLMLRWTEEASAVGTISDLAERPRPSVKNRIRQFAPLAAAAVFVGALSVYFLHTQQTSEVETPQFMTKGAKDTITVAVRRGDRLFTANHLDKLSSGDSLGFFYSSKQNGYLALFTRDSRGDVSVLFPMAGGGSGPIVAGENISLPDGAVVEKGDGCEWIIGVFSERVLSVPNLIEQIKGATETEETCGLSLDIPYARAECVIAFER